MKMIYLFDTNLYPKKEQRLDEYEYSDENDFIWKIATVPNGFFVKYCGYKYFMPDIFYVNVKEKNKVFKVFNTGNIFFQDADFDDFYNMRNIVKLGYTDDIWDSIEELLEERFIHDEGMIESEICT